MSINLRALVLNRDFLPISVFPNLYTIPAEEAIHRHLRGGCDIVYTYPRRILTPNHEMYWPSVIANRSSRGFKKEIRLRRASLFYRDHQRCAYCNSEVELHEVTEDHVLPVSRGGAHKWENVVLSCQSCNNKKGDNLPVGRWKPKHVPYKPTYFQLLEIRKNYPLIVDDERWLQFLPAWVGEVVIRDGQDDNNNDSVGDISCDLDLDYS